MNPLLRLCSVLPVILCVSLAACASGRAHENFKNSMQWLVGKSADDHTPIRNYPRDQGIILPNGSIEQEWNFGPQCHVYFEVDRASHKIVGWRYEGSQEDCAIVP